ncbi:MAG: bifunctional DNA primase/polymerase [Euryarchaeota archaeon]|nr:bifunctional DNA primase/polymerase [Euryarchaeota archaeon]MDE1881158.1 bifunctional DNA primase/polymerase [Euryarchaeota archaeon]
MDLRSELPSALLMARQGIRVFPVLTVKGSRKVHKHPLTMHGSDDGSFETDQLEQWVALNWAPRVRRLLEDLAKREKEDKSALEAPVLRWGMLCDKFVMIDLDSPEAIQVAEREGLPKEAPRFPSSTPGRVQVYCSTFPGAGSWAGRIKDLDSRGGGTGWTVLYGTFDLEALPEAPLWFQDVSRWGEKQPFDVGAHDTSLTRICGRLWSLKDATEEFVLEHLRRIGRVQAVGEYTYDDSDLLRIVRSIGRKDSKSHPERAGGAPIGAQSITPPPSPWSGRSGWEGETTIPILTTKTQNTDGSEKEEPLEPAYVLYNEYVSARHFRSFRTRNQQLRVAVPTGHGLRILDPVPDSKGNSGLSQFLAYHYFISIGKKVPGREITRVSQAFAGRAGADDLPSERVVDLSLRIAPRPGIGSILDLRDPKQRCVVVGPEGWRVEETGYPIFDAKPHMMPLPEPARPSSIEAGISKLFQFVLLPPPERFGPRQGENHRLLFLTAKVARLLYPTSPKPAHIYSAGQSSGKTSTAVFDQAILDPSVTGVLKPPEESERDDYLRVLALNRATINFDNISGISRAFSDDLCRLITGSGLVTRKKYSDGDEILINALPEVILNGITATPEAADLLRRCLLLRVVPPSDLGLEGKDPAALARAWSEAHAEILGTILELAVRVAQEIQAPQDPPFRSSEQMQAFHLVGQALSKVLGGKPEDFRRAFDLNLQDQGAAAAQTSAAQALIDYWRDRDTGFAATSAEIAEWMRHSQHAVSFSVPPTPHSVGRLMDRTLPTLRSAGIHIHKETGHASQLRWVRKASLPSSLLFSQKTPPTPPLESFGVFPPIEKGDGGVMEGLGGVETPTPPSDGGVETPTPPVSAASPPTPPTSEKSPDGGVGGVGGVVLSSSNRSSAGPPDFREVMRAAHNRAGYLTDTRGRKGWAEEELVSGLTQAGFVTKDLAESAFHELVRIRKISEISKGRYRAWS